MITSSCVNSNLPIFPSSREGYLKNNFSNSLENLQSFSPKGGQVQINNIVNHHFFVNQNGVPTNHTLKNCVINQIEVETESAEAFIVEEAKRILSDLYVIAGFSADKVTENKTGAFSPVKRFSRFEETNLGEIPPSNAVEIGLNLMNTNVHKSLDEWSKSIVDHCKKWEKNLKNKSLFLNRWDKSGAKQTAMHQIMDKSLELIKMQQEKMKIVNHYRVSFFMGSGFIVVGGAINQNSLIVGALFYSLYAFTQMFIKYIASSEEISSQKNTLIQKIHNVLALIEPGNQRGNQCEKLDQDKITSLLYFRGA